MSKMIVHGVKLTKDTHSIRVLYEKNGNFFVRSGKDGFREGHPITSSYESLFEQWGFRKLEEPLPVFRDREEMLDGVPKFQLKNNGRITYQP